MVPNKTENVTGAKPTIYIYIYSIYSQPITTRYMQIGTIEAKYKGKKLIIYPTIINQTHTSQRPHPTPTPTQSL